VVVFYAAKSSHTSRGKLKAAWLLGASFLGILGVVVLFLSEDFGARLAIANEWTAVSEMIFATQLPWIIIALKHR